MVLSPLEVVSFLPPENERGNGCLVQEINYTEERCESNTSSSLVRYRTAGWPGVKFLYMWLFLCEEHAPANSIRVNPLCFRRISREKNPAHIL